MTEQPPQATTTVVRDSWARAVIDYTRSPDVVCALLAAVAAGCLVAAWRDRKAGR